MILVFVTVLGAACGDDDAGPVASDEPPWGLTGIEMPDTEAEVIAVFEAMPAIDGHQPVSGLDEDFGLPFVTYYEYEEGEGEELEVKGLRIGAAPEPEPLEVFPEAWNIEASAVDPDSDLLWMAGGDEEGFGLIWAASDGSWLFYASADTAEVRVKLIHAFITAAGG
jgi:hypothetical protein